MYLPGYHTPASHTVYAHCDSQSQSSPQGMIRQGVDKNPPKHDLPGYDNLGSHSKELSIRSSKSNTCLTCIIFLAMRTVLCKQISIVFLNLAELHQNLHYFNNFVKTHNILMHTWFRSHFKNIFTCDLVLNIELNFYLELKLKNRAGHATIFLLCDNNNTTV